MTWLVRNRKKRRPSWGTLVPIVLALLVLVLAGIACKPQPGPVVPTPVPEAAVTFAKGAFPPPIPDIEEHRGSWRITDCIKCHSEEPGTAPTVKHAGMPEILLQVHCRTCHVFIAEEEASVLER